MNIRVKSTGEYKTAQYGTTKQGDKRMNVDGKFYSDRQFCKLFDVIHEDDDSQLLWKSHIRLLFDEIIQCGGDKTYYFKTPLQITINIIADAAKYAAHLGDEKMIAYFVRLGIYTFSDPTNKDDFDKERTQRYYDLLSK